MVIPFFWMISTSLKTQYDAVKIPPVWFPNPPQFQNYVEIFKQQPMMKFMLNTIKIVVIVVLGQLFFSSLAAYSFARIDFKGNRIMFFFYIATLMVPGQVTMIPLYLIFAKMHLTDTHLALILPGFFSAFGVFLLRQFFMQLPKELTPKYIWCSITTDSSHCALVLVFLALRSARAPSLGGARVPPSVSSVSCIAYRPCGGSAARSVRERPSLRGALRAIISAPAPTQGVAP